MPYFLSTPFMYIKRNNFTKCEKKVLFSMFLMRDFTNKYLLLKCMCHVLKPFTCLGKLSEMFFGKGFKTAPV